MSGQVIMGIAYGIDIAPHDDPYVSLAEKALQAVESASTTGWTFDMLPFCRSLMTLVVSSPRKHDSADMHLPWWFPGASFKKEAEQWAPHVDELVNKPYQTVKDALVRLSCLFQSYVFTDGQSSGKWHCSTVHCGVHDRQTLRKIVMRRCINIKGCSRNYLYWRVSPCILSPLRGLIGYPIRWCGYRMSYLLSMRDHLTPKAIR